MEEYIREQKPKITIQKFTPHYVLKGIKFFPFLSFIAKGKMMVKEDILISERAMK